MKISREWLQTYFNDPLPESAVLAEALTFHAFEIESVENDILDVKVTPNRGHDCLSHRGIAKELSAILKVPMKADPLRAPLPEFPLTIEMDIEASRAPVGVAAHMHGVKIGPSPDWLRLRLESVGQRSINNVVDATNYVMLDIGMPTHAFDIATFKDGDTVKYGIRTSKQGEQLTLLGGKFIELSGDEAVIVNVLGEPVDIGGVKGGARAELSDVTTELLLSASKFEPVQTRKAAQRFGQRTEAAKRFENEMADELPLYAIKALTERIQEVAGGEVVGFGVKRTTTPATRTVSVTVTKINAVLGMTLSESDVSDALTRLDLAHTQSGETFEIHVPFERLDISIPEDLIEEVGRIVGYDKVPAVELPAMPEVPAVNAHFYAEEKVRQQLLEAGFSEVFTSVFAEEGDRMVLNKVDGAKPYLRRDLMAGLRDALDRNIRNKDLLGQRQVKIFEIGTVWRGTEEIVMLGIAVEKVKKEKLASQYVGELALALGSQSAPTEGEVLEVPLSDITASIPSPEHYESLKPSAALRYKSFSKYPFIVRDIAMWAPASTSEEKIVSTIQSNAGELLMRADLFDRFEKDGRVSYAFRLVFQSPDRTLFDGDANERMESVSAALKKEGFKIR